MVAGDPPPAGEEVAFFEALMSRVLEKQEAMNRRLLEEINRLGRDQAVARDAAILTLLHRIAGQPNTRPTPPSPPPPPAPSSAPRWGEREVEALIRLRSGRVIVDWDEISAGMRRLGFDRSASNCRRKWSNLNWYFNNRRETGQCSYFRHLDSFYRRNNNNEMLPPSTPSYPSLQSHVPGQLAVGLGFGDDYPFTTTVNNDINNNIYC